MLRKGSYHTAPWKNQMVMVDGMLKIMHCVFASAPIGNRANGTVYSRVRAHVDRMKRQQRKS